MTYSGVTDAPSGQTLASRKVHFLLESELGDKNACFGDSACPITITSDRFCGEDLQIQDQRSNKRSEDRQLTISDTHSSKPGGAVSGIWVMTSAITSGMESANTSPRILGSQRRGKRDSRAHMSNFALACRLRRKNACRYMSPSHGPAFSIHHLNVSYHRKIPCSLCQRY